MWNLRRRRPAPAPESDRDVVARIAAEHLPAEVAQRWMTLLRPAIRLAPLREGERPVACLGGNPSLPDDLAWPTWDGAGPLTFIGELGLAEIATLELDISLPAEGRLLFFYFDGSFDNFESLVGYWDPPSQAGARMIYVPAGVPTRERPAPDGVLVLPKVHYEGRQIVTFPGIEHHALKAAFDAQEVDFKEWVQHPVCDDRFVEALWERNQGSVHQIGGYAVNIQGPVEYEVAWAVLGGDVKAIDPDAAAIEAAKWRPLFQVDSDDDLGVMWGDGGVLYWLARAEDLHAHDLTHASFTWQCG